MKNTIPRNRILAFGIILIAILLLFLPSSFSNLWPYEPYLLTPFRIIADLTAFLALIISVVLIWKIPPKIHVIHLVLFLSYGVLSYGIATLDPLPDWAGFEKIRWLLVILIGGLAVVMEIRFFLEFQAEFQIVPPNKKDWKFEYAIGRKQFFEWFILGNRLIYTSTVIIVASLLTQVFFDRGTDAIFVLFLSFAIYVAVALMFIYKHTEQISKQRILWIAYGFFAVIIVPQYFSIIAGNIFGGTNQGSGPVGWALGAFILVLSIAISLFATDIFNVQVVIRRTIVYAGLGLVLVFLFAVLEEALLTFLGNYFSSLVKYNSIFMAGILAVSGTLIKRAIEPFIVKYLKARIPE